MHMQNPKSSESPGKSARPFVLPPVGTLILCLLTSATFVAQTMTGTERWIQAAGIVPAHILHISSLLGIADAQGLPVWLTLFTYIFLHGGWWHVLPNMTALWVFGAIAEPVLGTRRFVLGYLALGVTGAFAIALVLPHSLKPVAGASGAISGILGAYLAFHLSGRARHRVPAGLLLVLEGASVLAVVAWLVLRTIPAQPDLTCSIVYHFIPFLLAWLYVRIWTGLAKWGRMAHGFLA
jgi:membrane associated rhomboid family serine protease